MARLCQSVTSTDGRTLILPPRCMANTGSSAAADWVNSDMVYPLHFLGLGASWMGSCDGRARRWRAQKRRGVSRAAIVPQCWLRGLAPGAGSGGWLRGTTPRNLPHTERRRAAGACPADGVILDTGNRPLQRETGVDLNSYAELAVRLVNTAGAGGEDGDRLANLDGLRALVADREHLNTGMSRNDLDSLRGLRSEFRAFFVACAQGDGEDAAARLNALLIQHPVHPQLSGHDQQPWHVHYTEKI